jgi:predicted aspartyl protease
MRVEGEWRETATTVPRPYLRAHIQAHDGSWVQCLFLVDTGADCTVLAADVVRQLGLPTTPALRQLGGIGGSIETLEVQTTLRLTAIDGSRMNIAGNYATSEDSAVSESILGYDVLVRFALIVDKPADTVCLLCPPHRYTTHPS